MTLPSQATLESVSIWIVSVWTFATCGWLLGFKKGYEVVNSRWERRYTQLHKYAKSLALRLHHARPEAERNADWWKEGEQD